MIFLFNWMILRFHSAIHFQGCTLRATNISHQKWHFEDDFPAFPCGGICDRSLEGVAIFMIQTFHSNSFRCNQQRIEQYRQESKDSNRLPDLLAVVVLDNQRRIEKYAKKSSSTAKLNNICFIIA